MISNGVPDPSQAKFVAGLAFLEQRHYPLSALALGFVKVNPCQ